jgi:hypothetical protein
VRTFVTETEPGFLDALNRLAISYRWVSRFIPLDREEARRELEKIRKRWFSKRRGLLTLLREALFREEAIADSLGFVTQVESVNAVEAWLGSLPGQAYADARRPILLSPSLAHLLPLSAVWPGPRSRHAFVFQQRLEFAGLEHLADDIAAAHELTLEVKLGNSRPIGEFLDPLAKSFVGEHIHVVKRHPQMVEDLHHLIGEPAHWLLGCPLHVQHDVVAGHGIADGFNRVAHKFSALLSRT